MVAQLLDCELEPPACLQKKVDMRICLERKDPALYAEELSCVHKHFLFKCGK